MLYDRVMAHGGYINHSEFALDEAFYYIHYTGGGIGPATLVQESLSAKKTHGDCVIADALTLEEGKVTLLPTKAKDILPPPGSCGYRMRKVLNKRKNKNKKSWKQNFDFRNI